MSSMSSAVSEDLKFLPEITEFSSAGFSLSKKISHPLIFLLPFSWHSQCHSASCLEREAISLMASP